MVDPYEPELGYPAGPLLAAAAFLRAPRFPTLHRDGRCPALNDWRTGLNWEDGADKAVLVEHPWAQVLTDPALTVCPCAERLPADLLDYRMLGTLLADARDDLAALRQAATAQTVTPRDVVAGMFAQCQLEHVATSQHLTLVTAARAELATVDETLTAARYAVRENSPARQLHLAAAHVLHRIVWSSSLSSVRRAADLSIKEPASDRRSVWEDPQTNSETLDELATAWLGALTQTANLAQASATALRDLASRRLSGVWEHNGVQPRSVFVPDPLVSRARARHAVAVWERAVKAGAESAESLPPTVVVFHDWVRALLDREADPILTDLLGRYPVLRVGGELAVLLPALEWERLETTYRDERPTDSTPWRHTSFGTVREGADWTTAIPVALRLWRQSGGTESPNTTATAKPQPLANAENAFIAAVGVVASAA